MKSTKDMQPETKFGKWLLDRMLENNYTCSDVAIELQTTRQAIRNHVTGKVKPSYVWVIAYCWFFNTLEDPYDIWCLTMKED